MEAEETRAAEALAMRATRADRVGRLGLSVRAVRVEAAPVYVPAYVFRSTHFGAKLRTFVSGAPVTRAAMPACCAWPVCGCGRQCLLPLRSSAFAAAVHRYVGSAARYELGQPGGRAQRPGTRIRRVHGMRPLYVQGSGWQDALPAGAGVSGAAVGVRVYDESKVALAAGALGAAAVAATGALGGLASWAALGWCVALPMVLAGSFAHWLPKLRGDVATYWQRMQRQRRAPFPMPVTCVRAWRVWAVSKAGACMPPPAHSAALHCVGACSGVVEQDRSVQSMTGQPRHAGSCGRPGARCWPARSCTRLRPDVRAVPARRRDEAANAAGSWDAEFVGAYGRPRRRRLEDDEWGGGWGFGGFGAPGASGRDARGYYGVLGVDPGCSTSEIQARRRSAPACPAP